MPQGLGAGPLPGGLQILNSSRFQLQKTQFILAVLFGKNWETYLGKEKRIKSCQNLY